MNGVLEHVSAYIGCTGKDGEMNKMTVSSNYNIASRRSEAVYTTSQSRKLPTIQNLFERGGINFLKPECQSGGRIIRDFRLSTETALTPAPGTPRPICVRPTDQGSPALTLIRHPGPTLYHVWPSVVQYDTQQTMLRIRQTKPISMIRPRQCEQSYEKKDLSMLEELAGEKARSNIQQY